MWTTPTLSKALPQQSAIFCLIEIFNSSSTTRGGFSILKFRFSNLWTMLKKATFRFLIYRVIHINIGQNWKDSITSRIGQIVCWITDKPPGMRYLLNTHILFYNSGHQIVNLYKDIPEKRKLKAFFIMCQ